MDINNVLITTIKNHHKNREILLENVSKIILNNNSTLDEILGAYVLINSIYIIGKHENVSNQEVLESFNVIQKRLFMKIAAIDTKMEFLNDIYDNNPILSIEALSKILNPMLFISYYLGWLKILELTVVSNYNQANYLHSHKYKKFLEFTDYILTQAAFMDRTSLHVISGERSDIIYTAVGASPHTKQLKDLLNISVTTEIDKFKTEKNTSEDNPKFLN